MAASASPIAPTPNVPVPTKPRKTAADFDFDAVFDRARQELLDMANLAGVPHDAPFACEHETRAQMLFTAKANWDVYYAWKGTTQDGFITPPLSTKVESGDAAKDATIAAAKERANDATIWERLRHELKTDPYQVFRSPEGEVPLGEVRQRFHAFTRCRQCTGRGSVQCCTMGGWICGACNGRRQKWIVSQGVGMWVNCYECGVTGWIACPQCNGSKRVTCANCTGEGGHTHSWKATLTGKWTSEIMPHPNTHPEGAEKAMAWPREHFLEQGFIGRPEWGDADSPNNASCLMALPFQRSRFAITHLDQEQAFEVDYLGRSLLACPMPPVLDAVIAPYVARIERSAGEEAFRIANETAFGAGMVGSVMTTPTPGSVVSQTFKDMISAGTAERVMHALEREASRLTRQPMRRAWTGIVLSALAAWAIVAVFWGTSLRLRLSAHHADADALMMSGGAACFALFAGAGLLWSRYAARSALSRILQTPVTRSPKQGASAVFGILALIAILACAIAGFGHR